MLSILLVTTASAQLGTEGTITGTVTDPSGAAVPSVAITITNNGTNAVTKSKTTDRGEYVATGLQIGRYTVRAESQGFKVAEQKDVVLNVGERARVDLGLEVGSTQESVTVEANAVAVQSESSEVNSVITGQQISQLATNGRSMYSLATLTPGASANMSDLNVPTSAGGDANVSFNGLRESHNLYLVDGGEAADRGVVAGWTSCPRSMPSPNCALSLPTTLPSSAFPQARL